MMKQMYWTLDDNHTPVPAGVLEWGAFFENMDKRRVALTTLENGVEISTVFLGLDHGFGRGRPLLFETMAFDLNGENPSADLDMERYSTWDEAVAGHDALVKKWRNVTL